MQMYFRATFEIKSNFIGLQSSSSSPHATAIEASVVLDGITEGAVELDDTTGVNGAD